MEDYIDYAKRSADIKARIASLRSSIAGGLESYKAPIKLHKHKGFNIPPKGKPKQHVYIPNRRQIGMP